VTVEPPKTAKVSAAPSGTTEAVADQKVASSPKTINAVVHVAVDLRGCFFCAELFCIRMRSDLAALMLHMGAANTCFRRRELLKAVLFAGGVASFSLPELLHTKRQ
jgi:hypothetical protein